VKTEISDKILQAASDRIKHFGYAKTTMAEIAADLRMSAGNLYRFFASKLDIAEALAKTQREKQLEELSEIVQRSDLSAREKLVAALTHDIGTTYKLVREEPRIVEIVDIIARERPQFFAQRLREEREFLVTILLDGIKSGEFYPAENVEFLAECVQSAITKFRSPLMMQNSELSDLTRQMDGVLELLMKGLNRRSAVSP
jgi:AcrR family transcriptional regulator